MSTVAESQPTAVYKFKDTVLDTARDIHNATWPDIKTGLLETDFVNPKPSSAHLKEWEQLHLESLTNLLVHYTKDQDIRLMSIGRFPFDRTAWDCGLDPTITFGDIFGVTVGESKPLRFYVALKWRPDEHQSSQPSTTAKSELEMEAKGDDAARRIPLTHRATS